MERCRNKLKSLLHFALIYKTLIALNVRIDHHQLSYNGTSSVENVAAHSVTFM